MVSDDARAVLMLHVAAEQTKVLNDKNDKKDGRGAKDEQILLSVRCCLGCKHASPRSCCEQAASRGRSGIVRRGAKRTADTQRQKQRRWRREAVRR